MKNVSIVQNAEIDSQRSDLQLPSLLVVYTRF